MASPIHNIVYKTAQKALICTNFCSKVRAFAHFWYFLGTFLPPFSAQKRNGPIRTALSVSPPTPFPKISPQKPCIFQKLMNFSPVFMPVQFQWLNGQG
jgi:hypothetical protein